MKMSNTSNCEFGVAASAWALRQVAAQKLRQENTQATLKHAVVKIFTQPGYRGRAQQLSLEFAGHDVEAELLSLIEECVRDTVGA
jgi:hypothetical protein